LVESLEGEMRNGSILHEVMLFNSKIALIETCTFLTEKEPTPGERRRWCVVKSRSECELSGGKEQTRKTVKSVSRRSSQVIMSIVYHL